MNAREEIIKALSKIVDVNDVYSILEAVEMNMLNGIIEEIVKRYNDRDGRKIISRLVEIVELENPALAAKIKSILRRRKRLCLQACNSRAIKAWNHSTTLKDWKGRRLQREQG